MEGEVEMEDVFDCETGGGGFVVGYEVDFEYEFDAFKCFDFCREETEMEARVAEMWFETARGHDPSPFVAKTSTGTDFLKDNINVSPKLKILEDMNHASERGTIITEVDECYRGWNIDDHMVCKNSEAHWKATAKDPNIKSSTLMKPTACQLAKQFWPQVQKDFSGFPKNTSHKSGRSHDDKLENRDQAPKRQKLEGGHKRELRTFDGKQETNFTHKIPQKKKELDSVQSRLKLTIPREPELQTARRAKLIRPKSHKEHQENDNPTYVFKARPLNKKILEAPLLPLHKRSMPQAPEFQVFHFKTSERAARHLQTSSAPLATNHAPTPKSQTRTTKIKSLQDQTSVHPQLVKPTSNYYGSHKDSESKTPRFKALPHNKQELSVSSYKRIQTNPPTDLFNKLSLASTMKQSAKSETRHPLPFQNFLKVSKENMVKIRPHEHVKCKDENERIVLTEIDQTDT